MVFLHRCLGIALILLLCLTACDEETLPGELPSEDADPAIRLLVPKSPRWLARPGDSIQALIQLADNEGLTQFTVDEIILDSAENVVETNEGLISRSLTGTVTTEDLRTTVRNFPPFYRILYVCEVQDTKGATAQLELRVDITPGEDEAPAIQVFSYTNNRLFAITATTGYAFNFSTQQNFPPPASPNVLNLDIQEDSRVGSFDRALISPNNQQIGQDSVFVLTDSSRFNYEDATYLSISQAYAAEPTPIARVEDLEMGDIVIVRLSRAPQVQFAAMKITGVVNVNGPDDYLIFDHKVTSP